MRLTVSRILVLLSGTICLIVTPPLALAYLDAYGQTSGESVPPWIEALDWLGFVSGLDPVATYNRYGLIFGLSLLMLTVSLTFIVMRRAGRGDWERLGWWTMLAGLGAVAVGAMAEYGIPEDSVDASWGFGLELLGFVGLVVGAIILGYAARAERSVRTPVAIAVGASGFVGVVVGAAVVGHLPSGPALPFVAAAMVIAIKEVPTRMHEHAGAGG